MVLCREEEHQLLHRVLGVVTLLLRFGADVNAQNQEGHTALHYAGNGDALNVAKVLLDAGADINVQDENGKTPLHHCIREGSLLVANLLVSRGAQIDCEDRNGETPLTLALHRGNMLQIILNQHHLVATAARRDFATSVLLSAVENEVEEVVRLLIEGGYSAVTVSNNHGETPVHLAIVKRNSQLMETLIGLDPTRDILTAGTLEGDTPVHYAARYGSVHVVERLLHHLSIEFGDLPVLNDAINPLNAVNNENSTCLYLAGTRTVSLGHHQEERDTIVQVLVHHGAHLFLRHDDIFHSGSSEQVIFHEPVGRGFALWAQEATEFEIEDGDDGGDIMEARTRDVLLTDFCVEWVAALASLPSSWSVGETNWPDFAAVLHVVVSAGYTLDLLPLLLVLPVHRLSLTALLDRLDRFARFPHPHMMLVQLHVELSGILLNVTDT
ncbi:Hypothetical protein PHPALM_12885 [Phytophthora palmivora]|uniref:Uncharacterized protein n=1 Tax=Phytophthora palmivora TaxID=4796 RepID=A0A2P4XYK8_9STRA|nr:Hypothetical protein PHPALM_12885 [Phytophthora palmivora]